MILQSCPHCHADQDVSNQKHGEHVRCVKCRAYFRVALLRAVPAADGNLALAYNDPTEVGLPEMQLLHGGSPQPMDAQQPPAYAHGFRHRPLPQARESARKPSFSIDGYDIQDCLGRGGMGQVYRAMQKSLGRIVAIKTLDTQLARNKASIMRFTKEAAAMAQLHHPNIVYVIDRGANRYRHYFVMEFIDGPSLRELMQEGPFPPQEAVRIMLDLTKTMAYAHGKGVIHRDLKPENLLFTADGNLKVADFGLAGVTHETTHIRKLTKSFVSMGTECYMAPEQRRDAKNVDQRADIYSMGVILFELVTGQLPFPRLPGPDTIIVPEHPKIDQIIRRCLATSPLKRFESCDQLWKDLQDAIPSSHRTIAPRDTVVDHEAARSISETPEDKSQGSLRQRLTLWPSRLKASLVGRSERSERAEPELSALSMQDDWDPQKLRQLVLTSIVLLALAFAVGLFFLLSPKPPHLRTETGAPVMIPWEKQYAQATNLNDGRQHLFFDFRPRPFTDAWGGYPRKQWNIKGFWDAQRNNLQQDTYQKGLSRNVTVRWALYKGHGLQPEQLEIMTRAAFFPAIVKTNGQQIPLRSYMRRIQRGLEGQGNNAKRKPTLGVGLRGLNGTEISLRMRPSQGKWRYRLHFQPARHGQGRAMDRRGVYAETFHLRQPLRLKMTLQRGVVTAWVNDKPVDRLSLPTQDNFEAHAGVFCRDAHCDFKDFEVKGFAKQRSK
ncbi:MAG: serine/threonine protein kinase [Myxococcales bacterium]|nr:serine/threonine protein kinase [Myxococcales bacterium]MCB9643633.1 serine/threonine protein kinase [Myxococcales bacterium]